MVFFRACGQNVHCFFCKKEYYTGVVKVKAEEYFCGGVFVRNRKIIIAGLGTLAAAAAVLGVLFAKSMYELSHFTVF